MYPVPGHLACGLTLRAVTRLNLWIILAATFLPDVIDKLLADVFHLAPYGRGYMHCIPVLILLSGFLAAAFRDLRTGYAWAAGHFVHLVADISFIPWWFPFKSYDWPSSVNVVHATMELRHLASTHPQPTPLVARVFIPEILLMETGLLAIAVCLTVGRPRRLPYRAVLVVSFAALMAWRLYFYA